MLFSLYTSELFHVISQHLPTAHSYADDTGIYLASNPNDDSNQDAAIAAMEACLCDIRNWMINDKLSLCSLSLCSLERKRSYRKLNALL